MRHSRLASLLLLTALLGLPDALGLAGAAAPGENSFPSILSGSR
jgi:hypothetical protein